MDTDEAALAPAVRSILAAARERRVESDRVAATARSFPAAFEAAAREGRVPVIAEVKPTSPTTEGRAETDPVALAEAMVAGGAAGLSVLTEPEHFGGSAEALARVREAVDVPVLRKDFLVREKQLDAVESDAVLLIARFLGDDLGPLVAAARERGMQPLVEVHTPAELTAALDAGADLVGVNNRDLGRLEVDLGTFERVAATLPDGAEATLVAESGIESPDDVGRMRAAGADALLIGTAIMDGDVERNTREFTNAHDEF
ncbi:MAG: indole-3-glycerol phosphate synthase [Haloferacaceae archaeon]